MLRSALPRSHPTIPVWSPWAALGFGIDPRDLRGGRSGVPRAPRQGQPWPTEGSTLLSAITPEPSAWASSHVYPQIQIEEHLGLQKGPGPTWGPRNSYLTVQIDTDQSDVAIEIHMLRDGSVVRGRDQESLWGQEWARARHPLAGTPRPPSTDPKPLQAFSVLGEHLGNTLPLSIPKTLSKAGIH